MTMHEDDIKNEETVKTAEEASAEDNMESSASDETGGEAGQEEKEAEKESKEQESEDKKNEEEAAEKPASEEEELQTKYMRLMADFQNFKRRAEKEKLDNAAYANEKIVVQLLEVMDNFERALEHEAGEEFKKGMVMIFDQLQSVLEKAGVEEIDTEDADFDPNFHNAVMMEDTEEVESGKVSAVLQKGYKLHGKVIRPSMVKVAN